MRVCFNIRTLEESFWKLKKPTTALVTTFSRGFNRDCVTAHSAGGEGKTLRVFNQLEGRQYTIATR